MAEGKYISHLVVAGIKQNTPLDAKAYIQFYNIFVGNTSSKEEKLNFVEYFFIPEGMDDIEIEHLRLIIELLCEKTMKENIDAMNNPEEESVSSLVFEIVSKKSTEDRISRTKMREQLDSTE